MLIIDHFLHSLLTLTFSNSRGSKAFLELLAVLLAVVTLQYDQDHQLRLAFIFNLSHSRAKSANTYAVATDGVEYNHPRLPTARRFLSCSLSCSLSWRYNTTRTISFVLRLSSI
jgi:hypothetical protein